jgi:hypothetical protein
MREFVEQVRKLCIMVQSDDVHKNVLRSAARDILTRISRMYFGVSNAPEPHYRHRLCYSTTESVWFFERVDPDGTATRRAIREEELIRENGLIVGFSYCAPAGEKP